MDRWEDKIISNKINSIDTLPEGYEPNLESKWALLETGLAGGEKKNRLFVFYRLAIAALFLVIGGGAWFMISMRQDVQPVQQAAMQEHVSPTLAETNEIIQTRTPEPQQGALNHSNKKHRQSKPVLQSALAIGNMPSTDTVVPVPQMVITPVQLAQAPAKVKKARFAEMDFNDQPIGPHVPSEPVMAAQQFRFRIGSNSVSQDMRGSGNNSIRFQRAIFN